jgi:hypothetical protein
MNVAQVCEGRGGRRPDFGRYFATVFLSTRMPSFASSMAIRRRRKRAFSVAIRTISSMISGAMGGRPMRFDFHAQNLANSRRCQATTGSGFTIVSVSAHRDQALESTTQKARWIGASCGRFLFRRSTASCCRSARFSATRLALGRTADLRAPMIATSSRNTAELSPKIGGIGEIGSSQDSVESADLCRGGAPITAITVRVVQIRNVAARRSLGARLARAGVMKNLNAFLLLFAFACESEPSATDPSTGMAGEAFGAPFVCATDAIQGEPRLDANVLDRLRRVAMLDTLEERRAAAGEPALYPSTFEVDFMAAGPGGSVPGYYLAYTRNGSAGTIRTRNELRAFFPAVDDPAGAMIYVQSAGYRVECHLSEGWIRSEPHGFLVRASRGHERRCSRTDVTVFVDRYGDVVERSASDVRPDRCT